MWAFSVFIWFFCLQTALAFRTGWGLQGFRQACLYGCGIFQGYATSFRNGRFLRGQNRPSSVEFPWLATINLNSLQVPGSLISDRHVITAASPLYGLAPDNFFVTLGVHSHCQSNYAGGLNVSVDSFTIHPDYSTSTLYNDIALVKLKHRIAFSRYIAPISMPIFDFREYEQVTWTAGWTINGSCSPQVATLTTLKASSCLKGLLDSKLLSPDKGCLGPLDTKSVLCKTDIGAPVMSRWSPLSALRLIGVISTASCKNSTLPLFTRVIDHAGWIYEYIRTDCHCF